IDRGTCTLLPSAFAPSVNPHFITTCGFPVRFVVVNSEFGGITSTSQSVMNFSNFAINRVRTRCARMYSTAGISRAVRNAFGQSPKACPRKFRTCPDIRGAANWMSTAYNPATALYYVMTTENCGTYRSTQFGLNPRPPAPDR